MFQRPKVGTFPKLHTSLSLYCIRGHYRTSKTLTKRNSCIPCNTLLHRKSYLKYKEKYKQLSKTTWYPRIFQHHLKTRYNMTIEDYAWLLYKCNFRCMICGTKEELHVDHCHKTGKIRGILCRFHNHLLGKLEVFKEDIIKLYDYLKIHD